MILSGLLDKYEVSEVRETQCLIFLPFFFFKIKWLSRNTALLYLLWFITVAPEIQPRVVQCSTYSTLGLTESLQSQVLRKHNLCLDRLATKSFGQAADVLSVTLQKIEGKCSAGIEVSQSHTFIADHRAGLLPQVPYGTRGSGASSFFFLPHTPSKCCHSMGLQHQATYTDFGKGWNPDVYCVWAQSNTAVHCFSLLWQWQPVIILTVWGIWKSFHYSEEPYRSKWVWKKTQSYVCAIPAPSKPCGEGREMGRRSQEGTLRKDSCSSEIANKIKMEIEREVEKSAAKCSASKCC